VKPPTNSRSPVPAGTDPIVIVAFGGGFIAGALFVSWALSFASPAVLKQLTHVANTLSPFAPFFTVLAAAIGWYAAALFNGEQARRTEREKREIANEAVRGRMRDRIKRMWGAIRQAVSSEKPYDPGSIKDFLGSIKFFLNEIQNFYWELDTFAAFTPSKRDLLRKALDYCQLDNQKATRTAYDPENWNPGECFRQSLAALEPVFRVVFGDEKIAAEIGALRHAEELRKNDVDPPK
jgi:hypothetical protein